MAPLEDTLLIAVENEDKIAVYRTYLDLEMNEIKDPARIQALFERIVADIPLYDAFWIDYCKYVDRQFKAAESTFAIFRRAIRNCPWNGSIWASYILAAERYEKEDSFISGNAKETIVVVRINTVVRLLINFRIGNKRARCWTSLSCRSIGCLGGLH